MPDPDRRRERRLAALRIAGIYAAIGALWILFSDRLAQAIARDPATLTWLQTAKGWVFVLGTGLILYLLVERGLARAQRSQEQREAAEAERHATERALAEKQRVFSTLLGNLPGMAYRCRNDPNWTMEFVSEGCEALTGYAASNLVDNRTVAYGELIHPTDREAVWADVQTALDAGEAFQLSYRIRTREDEVKWVWEQGCGVFTRDGELEAVEGFITDISERKRLEAQFLQAQKMESVGRLVGAVAHDFNNVLTTIIGLSQMLLMDDGLPDVVREDLEEIHKAGRRAGSLTNQLLSFSRQHDGTPRVVDVNDVVTDMEGMLGRLVGSEVELAESLQPELGLVNVDPSQVEQVLMNLVVNARDAMPDGGTITVQTGNVELDEAYTAGHPGATSGPYVMLSVTDTGVGMDDETLKRAFDAFFTTKEAGKGTGLGLATVYGVVKESGGNVWAYSAPGRGTTFKVYLPRVDETGRPLAPAASEEDALPRGDETILLVEDQESLRAVLRDALEAAGYRVIAADSGEAALVRVSDRHEGELDLLITDIMLPGMTGPQLAERVLRDHPHAKLLFLSGFADAALVRDGMLESGPAFLQKPFSAGAFLGKLRHVLDSPTPSRERV